MEPEHPDPDPDLPPFELLMPFVVTSDKGGPYDAVSFVAGARFKEIWHRCERGEDPIESYEPPLLVPQLDLVAMHFGYTLFSVPYELLPDEWTFVTLTRVRAPVEVKDD